MVQTLSTRVAVMRLVSSRRVSARDCLCTAGGPAPSSKIVTSLPLRRRMSCWKANPVFGPIRKLECFPPRRQMMAPSMPLTAYPAHVLREEMSRFPPGSGWMELMWK